MLTKPHRLPSQACVSHRQSRKRQQNFVGIAITQHSVAHVNEVLLGFEFDADVESDFDGWTAPAVIQNHMLVGHSALVWGELADSCQLDG